MLLMIRTPPGPTLFPYTTLFRSLVTEELASAEASRATRAAASRAAAESAAASEETAREIGRATRLNSSHVAIAYAVFCVNIKTDADKRIVINTSTHEKRTSTPV